jgi:hypothetical protein
MQRHPLKDSAGLRTKLHQVVRPVSATAARVGYFVHLVAYQLEHFAETLHENIDVFDSSCSVNAVVVKCSIYRSCYALNTCIHSSIERTQRPFTKTGSRVGD